MLFTSTVERVLYTPVLGAKLRLHMPVVSDMGSFLKVDSHQGIKTCSLNQVFVRTLQLNCIENIAS